MNIHPRENEASVISVYKPHGITPLQLLESLREKLPELKNEKLAYAGRLDPMAEGLLLVLVGEECKKREMYQKLPKSYLVTAVFGIETDTYDALGMIKRITPNSEEMTLQKITEIIPSYLGKHDQLYPAYSSARVNGKPLFYWARQGMLDKVVIPKKQIEITHISLESSSICSSEELVSEVTQRINKISGDFRQKEILEIWKNKLSIPNSFSSATLLIHASQGAYMRSLINEIGLQLQIGAIALNIKRLSVGKFTLEDAVRI